MKMHLYPKLAVQNILRQRRFFLPYLLTIVGSVASFYIIHAIANDDGMYELRGAEYAISMAMIGVSILAFFCAIFLFYTNSFLVKRRNREIALYNILGMEKPHIAAIMTFESFFIWLIGLSVGLLCGVLFHKFAALALCRLLKADVPFGFRFSPMSLLVTTAVFSVILLLILLRNLFAVGKARPIELLHAASAGEREPKTRWILTLIGIASLGGGYAIAILAKNPINALAFYFLAVFLVIIGTYCLFTAVSIAVLKILRANKRFYYKTSRFINISGMLYRMKQNAVGLANICILSTMVLVMLSGTVSLYLGIEDAVHASIPRDLVVGVRYDDASAAVPDDALLEEITAYLEDGGRVVTDADAMRCVSFAAKRTDYGFTTNRSGAEGGEADFSQIYELQWMTAQQYERAMNVDLPALSKDEVIASSAFLSDGGALAIDSQTGEKKTFTVLDQTLDRSFISGLIASSAFTSNVFFIVSDEDVLNEIYRFQRDAYGESASPYYWEAQLDFDGEQIENTSQVEAVVDTCMKARDEAFGGMIIASDAASATDELLGMAGGFLFLGVFLGLVFMMAAVLILYYKQICEGYEDRERFRIMQQVGLEKRHIKSCINAQILTVFFLPLIVSAIHVAFDFGLMTRLLTLFGLQNTPLTLLCSIVTFFLFSALYAIVYLLTARTYHKIIA